MERGFSCSHSDTQYELSSFVVCLVKHIQSPDRLRETSFGKVEDGEDPEEEVCTERKGLSFTSSLCSKGEAEV
jgi:hypothetical protein